MFIAIAPTAMLRDTSAIDLSLWMGDYSAAEKYERLQAGLPIGGKRSPAATDDGRRLERAKNLRVAGEDAERRRKLKSLVRDHKSKADATRKVKFDRTLPPIDRPKDELFATCIHEAGHAVAACVFDAEPAYATVVPSKIQQGHSYGHVAWGRVSLGGQSDVIVSLAGPIGMAFWSGKEWRPGSFGDGYDMKDATANYDLDSVSFHAAKLEAQSLVKKHWPAILEVAELLCANRTVIGSDIASVVKSHMTAQAAK